MCCRAVQSSQPPRILYFVTSLALVSDTGYQETDILKALLFSFPHLGLPRLITELDSCSRLEVHHEVKTLEVWCLVLGIWKESGFTSEVAGMVAGKTRDQQELPSDPGNSKRLYSLKGTLKVTFV